MPMNFYAVSEVAGVASVQHDVDVLFQAVPPLCCPPMLGKSSRLKEGHRELQHSLKRRGPGSGRGRVQHQRPPPPRPQRLRGAALRGTAPRHEVLHVTEHSRSVSPPRKTR